MLRPLKYTPLQESNTWNTDLVIHHPSCMLLHHRIIAITILTAVVSVPRAGNFSPLISFWLTIKIQSLLKYIPGLKTMRNQTEGQKKTS